MTPEQASDHPREVPPSGTSGPWTWIVTWGVMLRPGWRTLQVVAFDAQEALVIARAQRPDRPAPRTAYLAAVQDGPAPDGAGPS